MFSSSIKRIGHLIRDKKLSFIIGAGFSKNMSTHFISWEELLKPMVAEMYNINPDNNTLLKQKINEIGYLGIASEYVKRKGYHEAIDVYIEEHTPIIREEEGGDSSEAAYEVFLNGEKVGNADTTCHRLLMDLGIRHIYTFNYDNCLDVLGKTHHSEQNLREIWELKRDLERLKNIHKGYKQFTKKIPQELIPNGNADVDFSNAENLSETHGKIISKYKKDFRQLETLGSELHKSDDNLKEIEWLIFSLEGQIYSRQRERSRHYQLVASSHMLSLTDDKRNIYKLHGTLRDTNEPDYGFDGDCHCQYIITSEDYSEYPMKHEPFVNYMKIALLKGAFCIVGFSCDDPNFLSWISWVKDVVDKNPEIKRELRQKESARFFYIHSGTEALTADKKLLLRNHYIEFVDLSSIYPSKKGHKEKIMEFLTDITPTANQFPRIKEAWNNINKSLPLFDNNNKKKRGIDELTDDIDYIYNVQNVNRVPTQYSLDHFNREHVLSKLHRDRMADSEAEIKLIYSALNEEKLLLSHYFEEEEITILLGKCNGELQKRLTQLHCKGLVLENRENEFSSFTDVDKHLIVWNKLLNLDFKGAKKEIQVWCTNIKEPIERLKKIQFEVLFQDVENKKLLELINPDNYSSVHDCLNALTLIPRINRCFVFDKNGGMRNSLDSHEEVMRLKNECNYLYSFEETIDNLVESIDKKVKTTHSRKRAYFFGKDDTTYKEAFKVLSILFDLSVPLYIRNIILFPKHKWESVVNVLYEDYPYPCLFYTLQYNDRELTREISKKILYSNKLYDKLTGIVKSMFAALQQEECPTEFKEGIMASLPILLRGVNASQWSEDFKLFYNNLQSRKRRYDDLNYSHEVFYKLLSVGLSLTADKKFRLNVISDALKKREKIGHYENFIIIKAKAKLTKEDFCAHAEFDEISENYKWLCENASKPVHTYVLLNLIDFFDKESVLNSLERTPLENIKSDCVLMKALSYYLPQKSVLKRLLKGIVIESKYLWNNGITDSGASFGSLFLKIAYIFDNINFDNDEFRHIFDKMAHSFYQIKEYCNKERSSGAMFFLHSFSQLLYEMHEFTIKAQTRVFKHEKMDALSEDISNLIISISSKDSKSITEMIIKDDTIDAIKLLLEVPDEELFEKHKTDYILIANRIILKESDSLDNCIRHYSWIIGKYKSTIDINTFKPLSEAILYTYKPYFCTNARWDIDYAEKNVFEESLIMLYSAIKEWGVYDDFWDNYKPRYYK